MGFPSLTTLDLKKKNLHSFPAIEKINWKKHPKNIHTSKGHLKQERKNLQSTKIPVLSEISPTREEKTYNVFAVIDDFHTSSKAYTDLTGRFPFQSSRGNNYLFILYDYDGNAILAEPIKNRQAATIKAAWTKLHSRLKLSGNKPKLYVMDNECSSELQQALKEETCDFQLVPPHVHRRNAAERAISTFKDHLLSMLSSVNPEFPISAWDYIVPQAELTLNLLRNARANPALSAWEYHFGVYTFNTTPIAPVGTKVLAHVKPKQRQSWGFHGEDAWYIGPSLNHYRCVRCYVPRTGGVIDVDTVEWFPHHVSFPKISKEDQLLQAAEDIVSILQSPPPVIPTLKFGNEVKNALLDIATILKRAAPTPSKPVSKPDTLQQPKPNAYNQLTQDSDPINPSEKQSTSTIQKSNVQQEPKLHEILVPKLTIKQKKKKKSATNKYSQQSKSPSYHSIPSPPMTFKQQTAPATRVPFISKQYAPQAPRVPLFNPFIQPPPQFQYFQPSFGTNFRQYAVQNLQAQQIFSQPHVMHIYDENGKRMNIDKLLQKDPKTWKPSVSNELGRLADGIRNIKGTNTIRFIPKHMVPQNAKYTYANFICDYRPLKDDKYRVRLCVGGDKLDYVYDAGSPAASLIETKLILNSTISDAKKGARFMTADIKDFFLATPMEGYEYMRIHSKYFFDDIREKYKIDEIVADDGYVYVRIEKGMYGLKQAAVLAYNNLVKILAKYGYEPCANTNGIWKHKTRKTKFVLCVDDFGIKYFNEEDKNHLLNALKDHFRISTDEKGENYCGLFLEWYYEQGFVDASMPGYAMDTIERLGYKPKRKQHAPHRWNQPVFGRKRQMAYIDESPKLDADGKKFIQQGVGSFLYYGRAIDNPMLVALNDIGTQQSQPTENTKKDMEWLMDYAATYPNPKLRFYASDMVLHVDSDAAYLVMPNSKSRYAGYFYLSDQPPTHGDPNPKLNGPIHINCKIFKNTLCSSSECETGGVFFNCQDAIPIRFSLEALDHPQPATPVKTDNSVAFSFTHANIRQRKSKTWDMNWNWLRDKQTQKIFRIYWKPGSQNHGDYWTKHHSPTYHTQVRSRYVVNNVSSTLSDLHCIIKHAVLHSQSCARVC